MLPPSHSAYNATDGAAYEIFLGRWTTRLGEALLGVMPLPEEGALLDVGCGTGSLALEMARRWPGRSVVATDISEPYVRFAAERPDGRISSAVVASAMVLPFADGSFAAAAAQLVLNFVADPERALREMCRVTRPGGVVAASIWDFRGGLVYQRLFWDTAVMLDSAAEKTRDRLFAAPLALPDGLPNLFARVGLTAAQQESVTIRMDFANFDDYWQPLTAGQGPVGTYVQSLPDDLRDRVIEALRRAYCSGAPDGLRSLTATAWVCWSRVP